MPKRAHVACSKPRTHNRRVYPVSNTNSKACSGMKTYKWVVEIEVTSNIVADGFDLNDERMHDLLMRAMPYVYGHEIVARVLCAPASAEVRCGQGFKD